MSIRIGIGIITYNRRDVVAETLARVRSHTASPYNLVVADDGSDERHRGPAAVAECDGGHRAEHGHRLEQEPRAVPVGRHRRSATW